MPESWRIRVFVRQHQLPFVVNDTRVRSKWNRNYYCQEPSPVCLPSVHLTSLQMSKSHRPSPSIYAYCKRYKYRGGNRLNLLTCMSVYWMRACTDGDVRKYMSHYKQEWTRVYSWNTYPTHRFVHCQIGSACIFVHVNTSCVVDDNYHVRFRKGWSHKTNNGK